MNKIIIKGEFWDSYIYSNNLILIKYDGTLESYVWDNIIFSKVFQNDRDVLAYKCAYLQGDYLYGISEKDLFDDSDIKKIVEEKFSRLRNLFFEINEIQKFSNSSKKIELRELPIDLGIYNNVLYYCNSTGVFSRTLRHYNNTRYISSRETELWDGKAQCLKIGYGGRIALSASSDGLFEINFKYNPYSIKDDDSDVIEVSNAHSSYCSWAFSSLFSGSYNSASFLTGLRYEKTDKNDIYDVDAQYVLKYFETYNEKDIFKDREPDSLIISGNEKLYRITHDKIETVLYTQKNIGTENDIFKLLDERKNIITETIIDAEVVEFGVIVETQTKLYILLSNGEIVTINEKENDEIIRWRVFPRSKCYLNQLHIIYSDRIEILSFNDDYFVNQDKKVFGQKFKPFFNK